jgi:hypothetical protein
MGSTVGDSRQAVPAASFGDPDALAVLVDVDRAQRSPRPSGRKLRPVLDRAIRIGFAIGGGADGTGLPRAGFHADGDEHVRPAALEAATAIARRVVGL